MRSLEPRGRRLLVRPLSKEEMADETAGGIVLPQQTQDRQRHRQWEVVVVGEGVRDMALLPGARVLVEQYAGTPFEIDGETYAFVSEEKVSVILLTDE